LQLRVIAVVMAAATLAVLVVFPAQMETVTALDALILQHR